MEAVGVVEAQVVGDATVAAPFWALAFDFSSGRA